MPKVHFVKNYPSFSADSKKSLMENLLDNNMPVASSCGGDGICGKCKITLIEGELSKSNERELDLINRFKLQKNERISCQSKILSDIKIDTPYW